MFLHHLPQSGSLSHPNDVQRQSLRHTPLASIGRYERNADSGGFLKNHSGCEVKRIQSPESGLQTQGFPADQYTRIEIDQGPVSALPLDSGKKHIHLSGGDLPTGLAPIEGADQFDWGERARKKEVIPKQRDGRSAPLFFDICLYQYAGVKIPP